jgi:hypothetical protein
MRNKQRFSHNFLFMRFAGGGQDNTCSMHPKYTNIHIKFEMEK